jgi:hypothetical protein
MEAAMTVPPPGGLSTLPATTRVGAVARREIIATVHARRAPMMSAAAGLQL